MSDYFARCFEARQLSAIRTANAPKITPERSSEIRAEMAGLYADLSQQEPAEQLRRYQRMLELGRERGYVYDPDPAFDLVRIRAIHGWIAEAKRRLPTTPS